MIARALGALAGAPSSSCDREPVHVPGAVQGHGGLLAFSSVDARVVYRSENLGALLGTHAEPLGRTIDDLLGAPAAARVNHAADTSTVDLVPVRLVLPSGDTVDATAHRNDGLVLVEIERVTAAEQDAALVHDLRRAVQRIESATDTAAACAAAVDEVRLLTGYDRVMIYRFHEDEHGEVVAEARRADSEPYLGLHYPASDIPRPARRLLRLSPVRLIADVDAVPVPISGLDGAGARPLDLSRSSLRAVSPIHLEYLRNMHVGASLTISLLDSARLWGLIACHHGTSKLPLPDMRSACAVIARAAWQAIEAHESRVEHAAERHRLILRAHFLANASSVDSLAEALVGDGHSLLDIVAADGVSVRIDDVTTSLGVTPPREVLGALVDTLRASAPEPPVHTDEAAVQFPKLGLEVEMAAGVLALPLTPDWAEHVVWFRGEAERTVSWAGDPSKPTGPHAIGAAAPDTTSPRTSFAEWREIMRGRSLVWNRSDLAAVAEFAEALPNLRAARGRDALARVAFRDSLTGLPNRALLLDRLELAIADLQRAGRDLWILFIDLDGFKAVNDTFGHESGDEVLVETAERLRRSVRASDTVARLGGDEFVVVCTVDEGAVDIHRRAERLLHQLAEPIVLGGGTCTVGASIGIAPVEATSTPSEALRAADVAMYRAKRHGRGRATR